jgi:prepilin-type N-terminal cleavage/methylation domain-containing protein
MHRIPTICPERSRRTYCLLPAGSRARRAGFSLIELLTVMGIIVILGGVVLVSLTRRRNTVELNTTTQKVASLLREAQSRSVNQASSSAWGVHFDNTVATQGFYALFSGTYSTSSRDTDYGLPTSLHLATSSVAVGSSAEVTFAQISGLATGSTTIGLYMVNTPVNSTTITISSSGAVSY